MTLEEITTAFRGRALDLMGLNYKVQFDMGDEGVVFIDGTVTPVAISNDAEEADCTIKISPENLEKLIAGELNPAMAYTLGKIKVEGSTGVALKISSMLDS